MCGKQRLVVSSELKTFIANAGKLFPGAKVHTTGEGTEDAKLIDKVIELLNRPATPPVMTTAELGAVLGRPWRSVSSHLLTPEFKGALETIGWRYVSRKGRGGCRFERTVPNEALAA